MPGSLPPDRHPGECRDLCPQTVIPANAGISLSSLSGPGLPRSGGAPRPAQGSLTGSASSAGELPNARPTRPGCTPTPLHSRVPVGRACRDPSRHPGECRDLRARPSSRRMPGSPPQTVIPANAGISAPRPSSRRMPGSRCRACRDLDCRGAGVHPVPPRAASPAPQAPPVSCPTPDLPGRGAPPLRFTVASPLVERVETLPVIPANAGISAPDRHPGECRDLRPRPSSLRMPGSLRPRPISAPSPRWSSLSTPGVPRSFTVRSSGRQRDPGIRRDDGPAFAGIRTCTRAVGLACRDPGPPGCAKLNHRSPK